MKTKALNADDADYTDLRGLLSGKIRVIRVIRVQKIFSSAVETATLLAFIHFYKNDLLRVLRLAKLEQLRLDWFLNFSG